MSAEYRLVTVAMLALVTMIAFEAMAISTAMPVVAEELDAVRSYGLAFSIMLTAELLGTVVSGLWSDRRGAVPVLVVGQLLFAAGSVIAGLAGTFEVLLVGRAVAGFGAGLNVVALYVVVGRVYPEWMRPRVFSWVSAAWVLPSLIGPPVAGWLTSTFSWRWVFLVVLVPMTLTFTVILQQRARLAGDVEGGASGSGRDRSAQRRLLWLGLAIALSVGVMQVGAERLVPLHPVTLVATVVGLCGVALTYPRIVPRGTLRMARGLPSAMLSRLLLSGTFNGAMTFVPLMLVAERGLSPTLSGLMLTIGALGWSTGSWVQGDVRLAHRKAQLISWGGAFLTGGIVVLALVAALDLHHAVVAVGAVLTGLGMGLATSSTSVLTLTLSPAAEHGAASASLNLSDVLGSVLGLSLSGAVFAGLHNPAGSDVPVFVLMWLVLAGLAGLVVISGRRTATGALRE
jgi:MFS family permease